MEEITIKTLLNHISTYNEIEVTKVYDAYLFAYEKHKGQYRQSGDEYITHPLNVAYILSQMHADRNTIIAALLHDVLEDTKTNPKEIEELFGSDVLNLVDGVTKIRKLNFTTRQDENAANTRKIVSSITNDIRIIIIKLADRLHNMRTISPKSEEKKRENAKETLNLFVPIAYLIGAYRIKSELEDISFSILNPEEYKKLDERMNLFKAEIESCTKEMLYKIDRILLDNSIPHEIKIRAKNIYGVYKQVLKGNKLNDIHDLIALKIMVDEVRNCYITLGLIHEQYHPFPSKFKDFICLPKTNMYQSLHTTVFGPDERLIQTQIRTFDMDKVASFGITSYWDINKELARVKMQEAVREKFQFYNSLVEIENNSKDNNEFVKAFEEEVLNENVYVYDTNGEIYSLPKGSTLIDFAFKLNDDVGYTASRGIVNGNVVELDYELKNKDVIKVLTNPLYFGNKPELLESAKTMYAKRMIMKSLK